MRGWSREGAMSEYKYYREFLRMKNTVTVLQQRIEELEAERRWIPIKEGLPGFEGWFDVWLKEEYASGSGYYDKDKNRWGIYSKAGKLWTLAHDPQYFMWLDIGEVTHWRLDLSIPEVTT